MTEYAKILTLASSLTALDNPLGVYVISKDGWILQCNKQVYEILRLPSDTSFPIQITDFYYNPADREQYLNEVEAELPTGGKWLTKIIHLRINQSDVFVKDYSRPIHDENKEIVGFLCCIIDVTDEQRLFDYLPVGLYKLDEDDKISEVNKVAVEMLGYENDTEIRGKAIGEFFANQEERDGIKELIDREGRAVNKKAELRKKDGEFIFINVNAFRVPPPGKEYAGQEGAVTDITTEEIYRKILEDVPVGLYVVREKDGKEIITHCNKQFALINEFDSPEEAIGFDIKQLHSTIEGYDKFISSLYRSSVEGKPLHGYPLEIKTMKGSPKLLEVNTQFLYDRDLVKIGRAGAVRDFTELKLKVEELRENIAEVLHTYSSALMYIRTSLSVILPSLKPIPFQEGQKLMAEGISETLLEPVKQLAGSVGRLVVMASSPERSSAFPKNDWTLLIKHGETLRHYQGIPYKEAHLSTVRHAALEIVDIMERVNKGKLARELIRQVRNDVREVLRLCNLITVYQLLDSTLEIEHRVLVLREFIVSDVPREIKKGVHQISDLISQALSNLIEFARKRGVSFHSEIDNPRARVEVVERDVVRALINLLHNAIKYSWSRTEGEQPWVVIRSRTVGSEVHVEFENWGVPIPKDEIDEELIFLIGFRGRLSRDRGRFGTGIGLADVKRVSLEHNGRVKIESKPAGFGEEDDYTQPFLTTVTFVLPRY